MHWWTMSISTLVQARRSTVRWCSGALSAVVAIGCSDLPSGPGPEGPEVPIWLVAGLEVDPRTETTYVQQFDEAGCQNHLFAITPDEHVVREVTDLDCHNSVRLLFTSGGLLVLSEDDVGERLEVFDRTTLEPLAVLESPRQLGDRVSPSGRYVVGTSFDGAARLTMIDSERLEIAVRMPAGLAGTAWLPDRDALLVLTHEGSDAFPSLRLRGWERPAWTEPPVLADGTWPDPFVDVEIPGYGRWPGLHVSPDARTVLVSVGRDPVTIWARDLVFVDLETSTIRVFPEATGWPSFTPDGTTVVVDTYLPASRPEPWMRVLVIDVESLSAQWLDPPGGGSNGTFFLAGDGRSIVVTVQPYDLAGRHTSVLDLAMGPPTRLEPSMDLWQRASRSGEEWILSERVLHRLVLSDRSLDSIELPFSPLEIRALPAHELLVMEDADHPLVHFFDPVALLPTHDVSLPRPVAE